MVKMVSTELAEAKSRCLMEGVVAEKARNEYLESHSEVKVRFYF